jgi:tRNA(Glu) U13 pseudouridine synthase TruD
MNYNLSQETFFVSEIFNPKLDEYGKYNYYLIEREGMSHKKMCSFLPRDAAFCGIKDKHASIKQWFSSKERIEDIQVEGLKVTFKGCANERIYVGMHKGNLFRVIIELSKPEENNIKKFRAKKELVCNYFGEQRFSEKNLKVAELLEEAKYESALKVFLCEETKMDSERSRKMREIISENWGKWREIAEHDELKETRKRKVFDYLSENKEKFREAFSYLEPKSVGIVVKTAQAMRFNLELNKIAREKKPKNFEAQISGHTLAFGANKAMKRFIVIDPTEFEKSFRKTPLQRRTFFMAQKFKVKKSEEENKQIIEFELGTGQYATVFLKYLQKWVEN